MGEEDEESKPHEAPAPGVDELKVGPGWVMRCCCLCVAPTPFPSAQCPRRRALSPQLFQGAGWVKEEGGC
eukprot:m.304315 g.304315  ORF g.304315 m.304315 type:complete len:70 (-) comp19600_c8_seq1:250-459(-)